MTAIEQRLLTLGFEAWGSTGIAGVTWNDCYWHDDSGVSVRLADDGAFEIACGDPCAKTLPMLVTVAEAMRDLADKPEPYCSATNRAHVSALSQQLRDMHRSPDDIKCNECGHWVSDRALPDYERERFDPDTWCDSCLAELAADNNAFEREYRMSGRA